MFALHILSAIFFGSALSKVISKLVVYEYKINLFYGGLISKIPALGEELALAKSYDILEFLFSILFTLLFWVLFTKIIRSNYVAIGNILFGALILIQVMFSYYSPINILVFIGLALIADVLAIRLIKLTETSYSIDLLALLNGLLTGFYLMILVNNFTTTVLPLASLFLIPIIYSLSTNKFKKPTHSHFHLFLLFAIFFSQNIFALSLIGTISGLLILKFKSNYNKEFVFSYFYPIVFIFILTYNPLYALGPYDSVEEGFWAGWLSGLRNGSMLYSDIAMYHPPLLIWILNAYQAIAGYSIENTRLVLHFLQILGLSIFFFTSNLVLRGRLSKSVVFLLALGVTSTMVKNNVEIRLGSGLLPLLFIAPYFKTGKLKWLFVAGVSTALSILTSIEVGLASTAAIGIGVVVFSKTSKLRPVGVFLSGIGIALIPIGLVFALQGRLDDFAGQLYFYGNAFSSGYFNSEVERPPVTAFIQWHIINQFIGSKALLWEIAKWGIIASFITAFFSLRNKTTSINKIALILGIMGIILFRSALGRSDFYHLLFPLLISLSLVFYILENFAEKYNSKVVLPLASVIFLAVFVRDLVNASYLDTLLFRFQTYGKQASTAEDTFTYEERELVAYLKSNTSDNVKIFVYPWAPEVYFMAERRNATKFYTPYSFFTDDYQEELIKELESGKPSIIVYDPEMKFAGLTPESLPLVNDYITFNYKEVHSIGKFRLLTQ